MNEMHKRIRENAMLGRYPMIRQYVRDGHGRKIGVLVAFKIDGTAYFRVGFSKCPWYMFNVSKGLEIAIGRASSAVYGQGVQPDGSNVVPVTADFPESMIDDFHKFLVRCCKYFRVSLCTFN